MRVALLFVSILGTAQAHEGHGLSGTHWHATDTALWIAVALAGLALWWGRK